VKIGFIGLGNVGAKLAGSLQRNGFELVVRDLDRSAAEPLLAGGAAWADSPAELARSAELIITCLPSPAVVSDVMEAEDGVIAGLAPGKTWLEMSTTDESEVRRLAALVEATGAVPLDGPVSGGCHRAATGNIAIFVGGDRAAFEAAEFLMDYLKSRAPFWKKEFTADGAEWVASKDSDEAALGRW